MARVIKGGQGEKRAPRAHPTRLAPGRKVIDRDLYRAQQEAAEIVEAAEKERDVIIAEGKRKAAQAREEASTLAAEEAFALAAQEALLAFRRRAERYQEAADDIRTLANEVSRRIVGAELTLGIDDISELVVEGMRKLRARRKLRVQLPEARVAALMRERPVLMRAVEAEPDLMVEANTDVNEGFARVVLEIGGALCSEQDALDSLADAINVDETAVAPAMHSELIEIDAESLGLEELPDGGPTHHAGSFAESEDEDTEFLAKKGRQARREATGFLAEGSATGVLDVSEDETGEQSDAARSVSEETLDPRDDAPAEEASNRGRKPRATAPDDSERTMALDVSDLREELADRDRSSLRQADKVDRNPDPASEEDDLDLFADPSVPTPPRTD